MSTPNNTLDRLVGPNAQVLAASQATAIEQQRAVAEVQAMVVVAQQRPRNIQAAVAEMRQSCELEAMAERAFYRYSRGGSSVTGPTVHLMREIARCFGNVTYGIAELSRNDEAGFSEMQAYAWDLQTNTRSAQIFIVPHKRDKKGGAVRLEDMRDVYETTANQGARRVREAIRAVLPPWYVEEAIALCNATLKHGGGKPLPQRIANAIKSFDGLGVKVNQLETRLGRESGAWTEHDIAQLTVTYKSLQRGEVTLEDEFPAPRVTAEEVKAAAKPAPDVNGQADDGAWPTPAPIPGAAS